MKATSHSQESKSFSAMGTRCDIVLIDIDAGAAQPVFNSIIESTHYLEQLMSRFAPDALTSMINCRAAKEPVRVSADLWEIILACKDFYEKTGGRFDITLGPVTDLWKGKVPNERPTDNQIKNSLAISGFDKVELDLNSRTIKFGVEGMTLDFGAIGKGVALDRMRKILVDHQVKNALVSFGNSSVLTLGHHPYGDYWPVGVQDARDPGEYVHVFNMNSDTLTTSGNLSSIDPVTGYPPETLKTVSVRTESATLGEVLSTTLMTLPVEERQRLSASFDSCEVVEVVYDAAGHQIFTL